MAVASESSRHPVRQKSPECIRRFVQAFQNTDRTSTCRRIRNRRCCRFGKSLVESHRFRNGGHYAGACRSYERAETMNCPLRRRSPDRATGTSGCIQSLRTNAASRLARQSTGSTWQCKIRTAPAPASGLHVLLVCFSGSFQLLKHF